MAKKLQIMLSDEAELIMENLKVKQTKSFFTSMAIKHFSMTKEGKNFLKDIEVAETKSKAEKSRKTENHFLSKDKKVKLESWN